MTDDLVAANVIVPNEQIKVIDRDNIKKLIYIIEEHPSKVARYLLHENKDKLLHQMVICHKKGAIIRPHVNTTGPKSYVLISGSMIVVFFDDFGNIIKHLRMSSTNSNKIVYWDLPFFHTILVKSNSVCFLETTLGPHIETKYASWAPSSLVELKKWSSELGKLIKSFKL